MLTVLTVVGTRPEIVRLSQIIPKLDKACRQVLVNTRQNFDTNMNDVFFKGLKIREPDHEMDNHAPACGWESSTMHSLDLIAIKHRPDRVLILGDTHSCFAAARVAVRNHIPVFHVEAGNRSFDKRMPEEYNRKMIDVASEVLMPYTRNAKENLLREGIPLNSIYVTGNPIYEVIRNAKEDTDILQSIGLEKDRFFLVTAHRFENVNNPDRLAGIVSACNQLNEKYTYPVVFSTHPKTARLIKAGGLKTDGIILHEPFCFHDFLTLERNALCVVTDSGTVCEETTILNVRCVTVRDDTERPETIECGANMLSGIEPESILRCVDTVLSQGTNWTAPEGYLKPNVSDTIVRIVTGY